jgi:hypothetical protein
VGNGPTTGQGQPDASVGDLLGIVAGLAQCPGAVGSCKGTTYQGCKKGPLPPGGFKSSLNAKIAELLAMYCRGNPLPGTGIEPMPKTGNCPLITAGTVKCWIWAESQGSAQEIDPENEYGQYPTGLLQFGCASGTCHSVTASDLGCDSEWVPLPGGGCRRVSDFDLLDENDNLTLAIWALCNCQYKGQIGRNWPKKFIPNTGMQRWGTKTTPNSAFCCCMCGFRSNIEHGGKDWHDYWG